MPTYEYAPVSGSCKICNGRFERTQSIHDDALTTCPICNQPCKRLISAVAVSKTAGDLLSNKHIGQAGFTKYQKAGDGVYEKVAGEQGPDIIKK
ncbi:MAG: zinc ribbon domain-containing protein [Chrysiogenetes bacterium]|nr:zinc ribbon domain-containing protein [Chrysiogenetes bacterium]